MNGKNASTDQGLSSLSDVGQAHLKVVLPLEAMSTLLDAILTFKSIMMVLKGGFRLL